MWRRRPAGLPCFPALSAGARQRGETCREGFCRPSLCNYSQTRDARPPSPATIEGRQSRAHRKVTGTRVLVRRQEASWCAASCHTPGANWMAADDRLDSWKEIAAYLKRGVRTVQRWERTAGLPVRRVASPRGAVYAFKAELDRWWRAQLPKLPAPLDGTRPLLTLVRGAATEPGARTSDSTRQQPSMRVRGYIAHTMGVDPDSARAQGHLALYLFTLVAVGLSHPAEAMPAARSAAVRALEIDPQAPEALAALGVLAAVHEHAWREADRHFDAALRNDPVPPLVRFYDAIMHLAPLGRHAAALVQLERGLTDDPLFLPARVQVALELQSLGHAREGRAELDHVVRMDPQFGPALGVLGRELAFEGQVAEAGRSPSARMRPRPDIRTPSAFSRACCAAPGRRAAATTSSPPSSARAPGRRPARWPSPA